MRVLVVGSGGREHALSWSLARSPSVDAVLCAPGNAGIAQVATCLPADVRDTGAVVDLARRQAVDLVVVGPEAPLVAGLGDALRGARIPVFAPTASGAQIEGSKAFAKELMEAAGVPTAAYWAGSDAVQAKAALDRFAPPFVVKADGLAAGKGVRICEDRPAAEDAIDDALLRRVFGAAGDTVVIEEFLAGPEVSLFALCDGRTALPLVPAQDFKRALDGDRGLNTGGMGAYSPVPAVDEATVARLVDTAFTPTLAELERRGISYTGVLYGGLVLTAEGPKVLEFNARFGDPETQTVLPRLRSDLGSTLAAAARGELDRLDALDWDHRACVTVVVASSGYPAAYDTGRIVSGLAEAAAVPGAVVFHAGTRRDDSGEIVTAGGRVLAVSALGASIGEARAVAYDAAEAISFEGMQLRRDIAAAAAAEAG